MAEAELSEEGNVEDGGETAPAEEEAASETVETTEGEGKEEEQDSSKEDEPLDPSKYEPEVRKTPSDWYNFRHKLKEEKSESEPSKPADTEFQGELTPAAKQYLERIAQETFGKVAEPVFNTLAEQEATKELNAFLSDSQNTHFRKYTPVVEKYMKHPAYQGVPVKRIFQMLDYENATQRGADQRKEADIAVKKNRSGGTSPRTTPPAMDYTKLTPKQYQQLREDIMAGKQVET